MQGINKQANKQKGAQGKSEWMRNWRIIEK